MFGGPEQVLKYLARYVHRVAISNSRLVKVEGGRVCFRWHDYASGAEEVMALGAVEFIRRFLLHVLPSGFVQVRHYGFLANRCREEKLPLCRRLIAEAQGEEARAQPPEGATADAAGEGEGPRESERRPACPACGRGAMVRVEGREPEGPELGEEASQGGGLDTS